MDVIVIVDEGVCEGVRDGVSLGVIVIVDEGGVTAQALKLDQHAHRIRMRL
jgi:hypothetical protein